MEKVFKHPEWKRLYDAMLPLVEAHRDFSYEELSALAGTDIRSRKGRSQFYRFARELRRNHQLHMVCVPNVGYRIAAASEHAKQAELKLKQARKRTRYGLEISVNTRMAELSEQQLGALTAIQCKLGALEQHMRQQNRDIRKLIGKSERIPHPLLEAAKSEAKPN